MALRAPVAVAAVSLGIAACGEPQAMTLACGELQLAKPVAFSQCGPTADFTPINKYHGEIASIQDREDAVALINGSCTGTLIAAAAGPVVLTAGHCVGLGDRSLVAFNVEADPDGDPLVTDGTVFEQSLVPDYALIRLDQLPAVVPIALTTQTTELLAIIQHPRGGPKVIAEGTFLGECQGLISYANLDTLVGSSGAGVLNHQGQLLGVHTDGDCAEDGSGANRGWTAARIVAASSYLQDPDLGDL
jgi:trypsin-like peptidase